ncbi:MAG TPA: DNA translocase FtsK [bacterium]|nr:DNA translocase FtsK [bacterium]
MSSGKRIIFGVLIVFFSVYSFLSLYSYNILQETYNSYSISTAREINLGGFFGGILSNYFLIAFGMSSFLIVLLILSAGIFLILNRTFSLRFHAGIFTAFLTALIFLSLLFPEISYHGFITSGGGLIGGGIYGYLLKFFGEAGSVIIGFILFIISIYFIFKRIGLKSLFGYYYRAYNMLKVYIKEMRLFKLSVLPRELAAFFSSLRLKIEKRKGFKKRKKSFIINKELFGGSREDLIDNLDGRDDVTEANEESIKEKVGTFDFIDDRKSKIPPISLINIERIAKDVQRPDKLSLLGNAALIEKKLMDFGVKGKVTGINPGPIITMYEFEPVSGVKVGKILSLSEDLTMALKSKPVRMSGVIEGKSAIGIEVPNNKREMVLFSEILNSKDFIDSKSLLTIILGKNTTGADISFDIAKAPHLLIAGATGAGKSVFINTLILSLLFKASYEELNFLMIDPKRLELTPFENLPHLISDVIYDAKKAGIALKWAVSEMEARYIKLQAAGVKNIEQFNEMSRKQDLKCMPYLVIVIDELSDLMLASPKDIETSIIRLSQMARACGIHLIIATQRPSVNVVTGVIKANMSSRIAFLVSSKIDSRTILDANGAEDLLGNGDMLFMPPGQNRLFRIHGSYISEDEIKKVLEFIKEKNFPSQKDERLINEFDNVGNFDRIITDDPDDEIYNEVINMVQASDGGDGISISYIQRRFRIGFNRAARIMERLQNDGILAKKRRTSR